MYESSISTSISSSNISFIPASSICPRIFPSEIDGSIYAVDVLLVFGHQLLLTHDMSQTGHHDIDLQDKSPSWIETWA